ncbi:C-C chemokine receptor type 4-like [Astyanax mexicanus]|uniref:C-C chemokine receptor type 4-like n=1 Tax=Astyanax mexicanus TaxID=7994 RepID=A0A8T2MQP8_ASTMX|nr:C-C chemokine receptor type 4-like [Astyanax mexicanus]
MTTMMTSNTTPWEMNSTLFYNYASDEAENKGRCVYKGYERYFLPALYSLFFVVGFFGNALVVWVITVGAQLKSTTDVCLLNLALADILLVLSLPFQAYQMKHDWIFGDVMCTLIFGIYSVGFYGSIFFIVLMSIDRYLAIVHAVLALRVRTRVCGIVSSMVIWVLAVAASFPELLFIRVKKTHTEEHCVAYLNDWGLDMFSIFKMNIVGLLVPLIIVGFCYSMILRKLHGSHSSKKHSICLIILVMVVFFCCWTPYNIAYLLAVLLFMGVIPRECEILKGIILTLNTTRAVVYLHCCLNPFIYIFVGEKFRKHLIRLIRARLRICRSRL